MSLRNEQCNKVCRILDDVLANRPTERDSLITAVRKAFGALETEPQWISCKERLPENKKKVLVSYDTEDGKKVDVSMFDKYGCLLGLVSAWRPLPKPYTEEES